MFAAPDTESVREVLEATADEEGEALAIYYHTEAMGETARGRALGPIHIILADVPCILAQCPPPYSPGSIALKRPEYLRS